MKIFIFESIDQCSGNYHSEGGVVAIAKDKAHVKRLIKKHPEIEISKEEWKEVECFKLSENVEPKIWVMPDAGCC